MASAQPWPEPQSLPSPHWPELSGFLLFLSCHWLGAGFPPLCLFLLPLPSLIPCLSSFLASASPVSFSCFPSLLVSQMHLFFLVAFCTRSISFPGLWGSPSLISPLPTSSSLRGQCPRLSLVKKTKATPLPPIRPALWLLQ